ncbi:MAG TPA: hypothetical protein VIY48_00390 [Candidatus Paceibacterota bacterium]
MKLKTLTIKRAETWESEPGTLKAVANFEGPDGKIELELAPGFIVRVLALIEEDAAMRAKRIGASVQSAMTDAVDTARLIEVDKPLAIEA